MSVGNASAPVAWTGVVLAGGRSVRMGRDKALLPHPETGQPLVLRQLDLLRAAGCAEVLLSVRDDQDYALVPPDVARVRDSGEHGPLAALAAVLAFAAHPLVLVLAVDLPCMDAARLRALLALAGAERGVFPAGPDGRPEPLCAVYPKNHHAAVAAALASGCLALHALLADAVSAGWMRPAPLSAGDLLAFDNWNRPDDAGI